MAVNPQCISKDGYDAIVGAEIGLLKQTKITIINIIQMQQIKNSYLIGTKYGTNMVVELHNGEWYQQIHVSLGMDGGGEAVWRKLEIDANMQPILLNPQN